MADLTLILPSSRELTFDKSLEDGPLAVFSKVDHPSAAPMDTPFGGKLLWVGNATCIIEFDGIRFITDPNFLHAGDCVSSVFSSRITADQIFR